LNDWLGAALGTLGAATGELRLLAPKATILVAERVAEIEVFGALILKLDALWYSNLQSVCIKPTKPNAMFDRMKGNDVPAQALRVN
jgi:hypothetical protein